MTATVEEEAETDTGNDYFAITPISDIFAALEIFIAAFFLL